MINYLKWNQTKMPDLVFYSGKKIYKYNLVWRKDEPKKNR